MSTKKKPVSIMLRIHRASADNPHVVVTFVEETSGHQVPIQDAEQHGFHVSATDAAEVLALIRAQVARDNAKLKLATE